MATASDPTQDHRFEVNVRPFPQWSRATGFPGCARTSQGLAMSLCSCVVRKAVREPPMKLALPVQCLLVKRDGTAGGYLQKDGGAAVGIAARAHDQAKRRRWTEHVVGQAGRGGAWAGAETVTRAGCRARVDVCRTGRQHGYLKCIVRALPTLSDADRR